MSIGETVAVVHRLKTSRAEHIQFRQYARQKRAEGDIDSAVDICEMMVREFPTHADAHTMLATMLLERLESDSAKSVLADEKAVKKQAEELLEKAIKLDVGDWNAHLALCELMINLKRPKRAAIACKRASKLHPEHFHVQYYMGTAFKMLQKHKQAADAYKVAATLDPSDPSVHFFYGESILQMGGDIEKAVQAFQRSLELDSENPEVHSNLGLALAESDDAAAAVHHFQKAIDLDPVSYKGKYASVINELMTIVNAEKEMGSDDFDFVTAGDDPDSLRGSDLDL